MREDLRRIESLLVNGVKTNTLATPEKPKQRILTVNIIRTIGDRKPFLFSLRGVVNVDIRCSRMRAALLLTALLDLEHRADGGKGLTDGNKRTVEIAQCLDPQESCNDIANAVRVGLYRLAVFLEELRLDAKDQNSQFLSLESNPLCLSIVDSERVVIEQPLQLQIESNDQIVTNIVEKISSSSPLTRLRKRKVAFISGGPAGFDRLFLELFDHQYPVREHSLYFKPSIITYPLPLLEFMGVSHEDISRRRLMHEGLQSGRIEFVEILNTKTLWQIIERQDTKFKFYPSNVVQHQVEEHLLSLQSMVKTLPGYNLCLTEAPLPFLLSTFHILNDQGGETYSVFFKQEIKEHDPNVSCFVISSRSIYESISEHVLQWVLRHPTTIRDRNAVFAEIQKVLDFASGANLATGAA